MHHSPANHGINYIHHFTAGSSQFITRKAVNHELLNKLDGLLNDYFNDTTTLMKGLPTVQHLSGQLHISPRYLGDMLTTLTGHNTQQHIHLKLVERAKEILTISNSTVREIAYQLGFEYPKSFSKFFKSKTDLSPLKYRQSFN